MRGGKSFCSAQRTIRAGDLPGYRADLITSSSVHPALEVRGLGTFGEALEVARVRSTRAPDGLVSSLARYPGPQEKNISPALDAAP